MNAVLFTVTALAAMFGLGALLGAPFLPSRRKTVSTALKLLGLEKGQTLLDLGSGTGTLLVAAASKGIKAVGYEINPLLYLVSKLRTARFGDLVEIRLADYWHHNLPEADGIYVFLIGRYMGRLAQKLKIDIKRPTPVVSYAFQIPGKRAVEELNGLYLYRYYWTEAADEASLLENQSASA